MNPSIARRRGNRIARPVSRAIETLEARMLLSLSPAGPEFLVNTVTANTQSAAAIAMDGDGDFVMAWHSNGQDGSGYGIYAQRYNALGVAQGSEFRVNTFTTSTQGLPAIGMDADGDFVISWYSDNQDGSDFGIYAQRYNALGVAQGGEFRVNTFTTDFQRFSAIGMDADGDFVISWTSNAQDGSSYGIYAQRYNALGVAQGGEFRVNTFTTNTQGLPAIGMDADGDFVISWTSNTQDGSSNGIYAQRYNALGVAQGGEFRVNTFTTSSQAVPAIGMDADGDFVITWYSDNQDGSSYGIYAQRYNALGVAQGGEFRVNTFTTSHQRAPAIGMDADGDFVITWYSDNQDGSSNGIYAQRYNALGVAQGSEFQVNTFTTSFQAFPVIGMDADGDFVISWQSSTQDGSGYGIYAQRYDESTDTAGPVIGGVFVNGNRALPYGVVSGPVTQIVVGFSEAVQNFGGPNSVSNPANWRVTHHNGSTTSNVPISGISYFFNAAVNRFEATLNLSGSFSSGNFQVMALDTIRDIAGNALDGNLDGAGGGHTALTFGIGPYAPRGGEFQVNSFTTSSQREQAIGMDADGDFVISWQSSTQDGSGDGIYAQRYNALGVAQGGEFRVNTFTTGNQLDSAIGMDADGDFVISWNSSTQDGSGDGIYAQRYNALGVAQGGEFRVNTFTTGNQLDSAIGMDADGDFVISWTSNTQDGVGYGIYAQRYNALGVAQGGEFRVNTFTTSSQSSPAIGMDADGDFVISWQSYTQDGSSYGVYAQRYNALGVSQANEFRVNTFTTNSQFFSAIGMDADGGFVIAWHAYIQDGSGYGIYAKRYNALGVAQGSEFRVNTFTTSSQSSPAIGMDADGDFVISWQSLTQDGSGYGIYAQRYNALGVSQGSEFRVNAFTTSAQSSPAIGMDADGDFVISWQSYTQDGSGYGMYAQRYDLGATPTVGSLADSPDSVTQGASLTLTASGVTDDMFAARVMFYREANGIAGLQFGIDGDTPLATDNVGGDGWSTIIATANLSPGSYSYYAQATDDEGLVGAPATAVNTIVPLVLASQFYYDTLAQKLKFTFTGDVSTSLGLEDITLAKIGGGAAPALTMLPYGTDGAGVASFTMNTQLADGNYRATITALGVTFDGNPMAADHVFDLFILGGDPNRDRIVDVNDLVILANNWLGTGKTWSQGDFNYDSVVNQADLGIMATHWQQKLDPPPIPSAPVPAQTAARPARRPVRIADQIIQ